MPESNETDDTHVSEILGAVIGAAIPVIVTVVEATPLTELLLAEKAIQLVACGIEGKEVAGWIDRSMHHDESDASAAQIPHDYEFDDAERDSNSVSGMDQTANFFRQAGDELVDVLGNIIVPAALFEPIIDWLAYGTTDPSVTYAEHTYGLYHRDLGMDSGRDS